MSGNDLVMTQSELESSIRFDEAFPKLGYCLPLSRAAFASDLDLAFVERETVLPRTWRKTRNLPLVAVVTDTVGKPAGPGTWRSAVPLIEWAELAILHRAGGETGHYAHAVQIAKTHLRTLLIEAPAETFEDWFRLLQRQAELAIEVIQ